MNAFVQEDYYYVALLFELADEHYSRGGNVVIECWDYNDVRQLLQQCGSYEAAEDLLKRLMSVWHDRMQLGLRYDDNGVVA